MIIYWENPYKLIFDTSVKVDQEYFQDFSFTGIKITGSELDVFKPKMSPTILFSGMHQKPFIYRRNRTNSQ